MNPDTNRFEEIMKAQVKQSSEQMISMLEADRLLRPDGTPVPDHWTTFQVGESVEIKGYVFKVAYIGETSILFEPVGIPTIGAPREEEG